MAAPYSSPRRKARQKSDSAVGGLTLPMAEVFAVNGSKEPNHWLVVPINFEHGIVLFLAVGALERQEEYNSAAPNQPLHPRGLDVLF